MQRTTLYKIKKGWALALNTRGQIYARTIRWKFERPSNSVLMRAEKSTKAGKDDEAQCKTCQQLIDSLFGPATSINDIHLRKATYDQKAEAPVPCGINTKSECVKGLKRKDELFFTDTLDVGTTETTDNPLDLNHTDDVYALKTTTNKDTEEKLAQNIKVTDQTSGTFESLGPGKLKISNDPLEVDHIYDVHALQSTTYKKTPEHLAQKIEVIDETPLVEAEKQEIEDSNVAPQVLGQTTTIIVIVDDVNDKLNHAVNVAIDDSNRRNKDGAAEADTQNPFDALAKRCLGSPTSRIDEHIIKEIKEICVPQTGSREDFGLKVQTDVIKKRKPVEKTEVELEARRFERESSPVPSEKLHPAFQVASTIHNSSANNAPGQLMCSERAALSSDVKDKSDQRPKFDPNKVIIDPFDKKTIAFDTEYYGYGLLNNFNEVPRNKAATFINRQNSAERATLAYSVQDVKELAVTPETKSKPSHFYRSFGQSCVNPLINEETSCSTTDGTVKYASVPLDPLPEINPKGQKISLTEMLRRVRLRNHMLNDDHKIMDPAKMCGKITPRCPPNGPEKKSAPKKDPCALKKNPCKKKDPCAPKKDPCAPKKKDPCAPKKDPCAPKKKDPCSPKKDPCAPKKDPCAPKKDPCAPKKDPCAPKKNPCANFISTYLRVTIDDLLPVVLSDTATIFPWRNHYFSNINCKSAHFLNRTGLTNSISVPLKALRRSQLSTNICSHRFEKYYSKLENIVRARSFEPWVPIPSHPTPKKMKKEPVVFPKEGCKYRPQPSLHPCEEKAGEPCSDFPRPKRQFSLIDSDSIYSI